MPLSTLQAISRNAACKTRGQDGFAAFLSCRALSSPTTCRFIPALSELPTSMISPCQEGKSSPDALGRSANKSLQISPDRLCASRRWFLFDREPDIHLLSRPRRASQKIEFVISCQSRNNSMGASGAYAPSLSRLLTRPGRLRAEEILLIFSAPCYAAVRCEAGFCALAEALGPR